MTRKLEKEYPQSGMSKHIPPSQASVIITGLIRNGGKVVVKEILNLKSAFAGFHKVSFLIVESDSTDKTVETLKVLSKEIPDFEFLTLGELLPSIPNRIDRISYCRDIAQKHILNQDFKYDYVAVVDLDGVNHLLTKEAVESCWSQNEWDVCTANQAGPYYDIYALRAERWCPENAWTEQESLVAQGMHPMKARAKAVFSRQRVIHQTDSWIPVGSAFGGLAIYTRKSFERGRYGSRDSQGRNLCEHVVFNETLGIGGGKIFINPRLINSKGNDLRRADRRLKNLAKYTLSLLAPGLFLRWVG